MAKNMTNIPEQDSVSHMRTMEGDLKTGVQCPLVLCLKFFFCHMYHQSSALNKTGS